MSCTAVDFHSALPDERHCLAGSNDEVDAAEHRGLALGYGGALELDPPLKSSTTVP